MSRLFIICLFLIGIISCTREKSVPKDILPPAKMQAVLWDMISAGEFINAFVMYKDSIDKTEESLKRYGQVFQFHKVTKAQFDRSWLYYRRHPEKMKPILDSLSRKQAPVPDTINKTFDTLIVPRDTIRRRFRNPGRLS
jgi:hypothetical protein